MKKSKTILLLLAHATNARLLQQFLQPRYRIINTIPALTEATWDLCIIDGPALSQTQVTLLQHKQTTALLFAPVLLVTTRATASKLPPIVDDVLLLPTSPVEITVRIESLLRIRQLTQKSATLYLASQQVNQQLAQERSVRERFVTALTHDLRSPLAAIKIITQLIAQSAHAEQQPLLQQANQTLNRMEALLQLTFRTMNCEKNELAMVNGLQVANRSHEM